ncbi:adenylyltransferase/cytidyltransferase family protein [Candidatus Micrarchaeota archaeon]|nr:adenylyltransferase/cytidyltransferase family protein [Candidatus Micrarchaeota archaeon]
MNDKAKVVLTGGVFDILHPGHVFFLNECRKLGDKLVVVIATDATAEKMKGRKPIHSAQSRALLVGNLKIVDEAIVGSDENKMEVIEKIKPDVVVFGHDQEEGEFEKLKEKRVKVVKLEQHFERETFKTTKIIENIRKR